MNLRVYCVSLCWCLVFSHNQHDVHQIHRRENRNSARAFQTNPALAFYLQNDEQGPVYVATESSVAKRPLFEYTDKAQRNTHGGRPIHFNKDSPFHPDRNMDIIISPYDQIHRAISERSTTEKPREERFFDNAGTKGSEPDNQFAFDGSQTYFHETNSTHTVSHKSEGTFIDSYGNRHEISKTGSKKTSEENVNSYFVTKSNSNSHGISESVDRNRFNDYGSGRHQNRDFHSINRLENNKNPASKIRLNEINLYPSHQAIEFTGANINAPHLGEASGTINFGDVKVAENSPNIQKTGTLQFGNFKIQSNQPTATITRTFYVNGVKVDDENASIDSIINSFLINSYLNHTNRNIYGKSDENRYNPNIDLNIQQNGNNNPEFVPNQLSNREHYKNNFGNGQNRVRHPSNNYDDNKETYWNQQPQIDIRMGHESPVLGKLAKLREKGKNIKNATSIYGFGHKRAVTDSPFNDHNSHEQDGHIGKVTLSRRIVFTGKTENVEETKRQQHVITTAKRLKFL